MLLVVRVQLMMLNIKYMSITLILQPVGSVATIRPLLWYSSHIIGGRLAIIGGRLSATKKITNKVSTFDEDSQTWSSYYPDLLSVRSRPGVVSHLEHVIVAGGARRAAEDDDTIIPQDDIEVLNWIENSHWRKVSIKLPVPMYGFTPTISDGDLIIVGYGDADMQPYNGAYKIPVTNITASVDQQHNIAHP